MAEAGDITAVRWNRIRVVAWSIWVSKVISFLAVLLKTAPPEIKNPYLFLRTTDILIGLPITLIFYHRKVFHWALWRYALIFYTVLAFTIEAILTYRPQGGVLAWSPLVVGLGCFFLFDPLAEWRKALGGILAGAALSLLAMGIHRYICFLPADNPVADNLPRTILLILAGAIGSYFVLRQYRDILRHSASLAEAEREALLRQEALAQGLAAEKQQLAQALEALESLRQAEQRRAQREATLSRYETLMRESYTEPIPAFFQRLLDQFAAELPMLGGVIYLSSPSGWKVESAYALRQYLGKTHPGGTIATAANLKAPYLIYPAPKGTAKIQTSVATLTPKAVLYLPFYSEATGETLAVAELLLSETIDPETEALLQMLLPRIGTYLWARQGSLSTAS